MRVQRNGSIRLKVTGLRCPERIGLRKSRLSQFRQLEETLERVLHTHTHVSIYNTWMRINFIQFLIEFLTTKFFYQILNFKNLPASRGHSHRL